MNQKNLLSPKLFEKEKDKRRPLYVLISFLLLALIGLGIFTYTNYTEYRDTKNELLNDKLEIQADLDEKIRTLNDAIKEKTALNDELLRLKDSLVSFKEKLRQAKRVTYSTIKKYKSKLRKLETEKTNLLQKVEQLRQENYVLNIRIDSAKAIVNRQKTVIDQKQKEADSLLKTTQKLSKTISKAARLKVGNIDVIAMHKKSSGKLKQTYRARRTDALRVQFTVRENNIAQPGQKEIYMVLKDHVGKIINPKGEFKNYMGKTISYTKAAVIPYENLDKDFVVIMELPPNTLQKGKYFVELYLEGELKTTGEVVLK